MTDAALAALRQSEQRFRDYTAAMADWTWEADADGRFTEIAEEAREFGIDPVRLIGLDRLTEQDTEDELGRRRAVLARKMPFRDLLCRYDWEGFTLIFMLHGVPVHDSDGTFRGYRGGARNMTLAHELMPKPGPPRSLSPRGLPPCHVTPLPETSQTLESPPAPVVTMAGPLAAVDAPRRLNILVVEDDAVNRLVIGGFLKPHGHTVAFAHDGEQGVAAARALRHDVVLMDVMMPGIDGLAATRLIRALPPPLGDVPIIALTANAMEGDRERYLAGGMTAYVTKPIDRRALFATIELVVGGRAFGAAPARAPTPSAPDAKQTAMLEELAESLDL